MATITYPVIRKPETERMAIQRPRGKMAVGLYGYQWTVTDETGKKHTLSGITQAIRTRLSAYITQINKPVDENSSELHRLARDPKNRTVIKILGPYDKSKDPKALEQELIQSVPEDERLNRTSGGNGGGAWSQYEDPTPTVSTFVHDTPQKYYRFKVNDGIIVPEFSPGVKKMKKGVYVIKHTENDSRYVGHSTDAISRLRVHASKATHRPTSKVAKAIAQSPERHVFGILPSTTHLTPRSERAAEIFHVADKQPVYNGDKGGGGPAPMMRGSEERPTKIRKLRLEDDKSKG